MHPCPGSIVTSLGSMMLGPRPLTGMRGASQSLRCRQDAKFQARGKPYVGTVAALEKALLDVRGDQDLPSINRRNSARVRASSRNAPSILLVTIETARLWTPRVVMH